MVEAILLNNIYGKSHGSAKSAGCLNKFRLIGFSLYVRFSS
jgi:hypothetical protein